MQKNLNNFYSLSRTLLGDSQRHLYDCYKRAYAEMLYRWNLLIIRSKVLKYISVPAEAYRDVEFVAECTTCMKVTRAPVCKECHNPLLKCSLCRLPVKGLANACLSCGHGGHSDHMKKWFSVSSGMLVEFIRINRFVFIVFNFRKMTFARLDVAASAWNMSSNSNLWPIK